MASNQITPVPSQAADEHIHRTTTVVVDQTIPQTPVAPAPALIDSKPNQNQNQPKTTNNFGYGY